MPAGFSPYRRPDTVRIQRPSRASSSVTEQSCKASLRSPTCRDVVHVDPLGLHEQIGLRDYLGGVCTRDRVRCGDVVGPRRGPVEPPLLALALSPAEVAVVADAPDLEIKNYLAEPSEVLDDRREVGGPEKLHAHVGALHPQVRGDKWDDGLTSPEVTERATQSHRTSPVGWHPSGDQP